MTDPQLADKIQLDRVLIEDEEYFKIANSDRMRPFFMSIVSPSDHWLFISSNGGLTAGRRNSDRALFPYYTDDKITESTEVTGSKSIFLVVQDGGTKLWEPLSERFDGRYEVRRNLYKSVHGNKVRFEELNLSLQLSFYYEWNVSEKFGFVRSARLQNDGAVPVEVHMLDGLQNILPANLPSDVQNQTSNLADAYKRSELDREMGLAIYALSAIIVDRAEPSESLKANVAWSTGLENPSYLLSSLQLKDFRQARAISEEADVKGEKGAFFVHATVSLPGGGAKQWMIIADVHKSLTAVVGLSQDIRQATDIQSTIREDIREGTDQLIALNASADGLQLTADRYRDARHLSNVMFNIMRGGIFDDHYWIEKGDFLSYLEKANREVHDTVGSQFRSWADRFSLFELRTLAQPHPEADVKRLCLEYLPLKFSRRHGDPSRPWNKFSINTRNEVDGSKILNYEGNWRDIFQNWEALAYSYPEFLEAMIYKFLNATTFDGYNPYRVTKGGFDWETIEPDDPWSYIGYWGDHQIIYLLKFLEFAVASQPDLLPKFLHEDIFVYANVPYRIKPFDQIVQNPKDTINFDAALDARIRLQKEEEGSDGALLRDPSNDIYHVSFVEKLLATVLAKMSNLVPEGGIWMNTQRPEWNDANNALVGNGLSMVTLYYLRRFLQFLKRIIKSSDRERTPVSRELIQFYDRVVTSLDRHVSLLSQDLTDADRGMIAEELGRAGSDYRDQIYDQGFSGEKERLSLQSIDRFISVSLKYLDHSIRANRRDDRLYHAYNILYVAKDRSMAVAHLSEMLEGQVAVLSSGFLSATEALELLDALKDSRLFRADQYSYLLYPNKALPRFVERNTLRKEMVDRSALLKEMLAQGDRRIIEEDVHGDYHFHASFRNAEDLQQALTSLVQSDYRDMVDRESDLILEIFEATFDHRSFTGRSGTFYGYEGLGSIYWHMVSKLLLAVQECCLRAIRADEDKAVIGRLVEHYYEISAGIGIHKPAELYGAFPTDPYSHTPAGKGAQQPGMTGQVKEDILCRFGELGIYVQDGCVRFDPCLLRVEEFLTAPGNFTYLDVFGSKKNILLEAGSLCFTFCQVPIVYRLDEADRLMIMEKTGVTRTLDHWHLDADTSTRILRRCGEIEQIAVHMHAEKLLS